MLFKKKKKKEQPVLIPFKYTLYVNEGGVNRSIKCVGFAVTKKDFASYLVDQLDFGGANYFTTEDGKKLVVWIKDIYKVVVE